jgi:hypothetical protein
LVFLKAAVFTSDAIVLVPLVTQTRDRRSKQGVECEFYSQVCEVFAEEVGVDDSKEQNNINQPVKDPPVPWNLHPQKRRAQCDVEEVEGGSTCERPENRPRIKTRYENPQTQTLGGVEYGMQSDEDDSYGGEGVVDVLKGFSNARVISARNGVVSAAIPRKRKP